jgi:hypothetical protein
MMFNELNYSLFINSPESLYARYLETCREDARKQDPSTEMDIKF